MPAVRRALLNSAAVPSLLICLAVGVTWGRSYETGDTLYLGTLAFISEGGSYAAFFWEGGHGKRWSWGAYAKRCGAARAARSLVHFRCAKRHAGFYEVVVPQWIILGLFGVLPAARIARWRRLRRRAGVNTCRHCGYDLTGNVSGVCPECGQRGAAGGDS